MYDPDPAGFVINWPLGSGSVTQGYRSADLDPTEILTNPNNLFLSIEILCQLPFRHLVYQAGMLPPEERGEERKKNHFQFELANYFYYLSP